MKRHTSRARQQSARRPRAQPCRYHNQADVDEQLTLHEWHTFDANIQVLAEETESLSTLLREWLVRGIQAVAQAVKLQIAGGAVPPDRQLPPPKETDGDDRDTRTLDAVSRRRQRPQ